MSTDTIADGEVKLNVVSDASGRMRVQATGFHFDTVRAVAIEDTVAKVTGVGAVYAYPRTASVVVLYSPENCDTTTVLWGGAARPGRPPAADHTAHSTH